MSGRVRRRVYAVANQKGGVGKTTTAVNLAAAVAEAGVPTLLVDCDPQRASATMVVGVDAEQQVTLGEVMLQPRRYALADTLWEATSWGFDFVASDLELANKDRNRWTADEYTLSEKLDGLPDDYGVVLLDCPPNLGVMTTNALVAADGVIVVTEPTYLSLLGLGELTDSVSLIRKHYNSRLAVSGVIVNMFDSTRESRESLEELRDFFDDENLIWDPPVPLWTAAREAARAGASLRASAGTTRGRRLHADQMADMYAQLATRLLT